MLGEPLFRGVWPVQEQELASPVPPTPVQPLSHSGTGDLGLWSMDTFRAFSSCLGCLHPSVFSRMETTGLVSAEPWAG